jgi:hypothetical protein
VGETVERKKRPRRKEGDVPKKEIARFDAGGKARETKRR